MSRDVKAGNFTQYVWFCIHPGIKLDELNISRTGNMTRQE